MKERESLVGCLRGPVEKVEKGRREREINKKKEKREGRKKGGTSRGAEKTKRNCGLAAVDDLGGEGRGSRPGSGMLDLLLLFEYPPFSRGPPRYSFSLNLLSLSFIRSRILSYTCVSYHFVSLYLFVHGRIVVVVEKKEEEKEDRGGGGGRKDDKRQG